jgi:hypothetical protein
MARLRLLADLLPQLFSLKTRNTQSIPSFPNFDLSQNLSPSTLADFIIGY